MRYLRVFLFLFLLSSGGCGSSPPALAPVQGVVSYRGTPLTGGMIVFTPDESRGTHGPLAHAIIQPDGSYSLRTGEESGAVPGWHRITVVAVETPGEPAPRWLPRRSLLPEKYRDPDLSGLCQEVKANQVNIINLDLQ